MQSTGAIMLIYLARVLVLKLFVAGLIRMDYTAMLAQHFAICCVVQPGFGTLV
jgi:hypothetical protein